MQTVPPEFEIQVGVLVREAMSLAQSMALQMVKDAFETGVASLGAPVSSAAPLRPGKKKASLADKPTLRRKPRSSAEMAALRERFIAEVRAHPGEGMSSLSSRVGVSSRELEAVLPRLKREGKVRLIGSRGSARYFPATESAGTNSHAA